ncbi:cytochrome bd-type quinol oxidase subunit 2 [Nocardioides aromaticivorans]|uniref:Cytochrome bd-type quinol oxidase subunit 2 n=1 Tax=Nocardioides aromaticivorans TaxID=200618 RepID=A0A7Y9ZLS3_9ACTN|nr:Pr6Pr family membrane protein [Nocardioides aromaticivorans]NYI46688.1 cytochrome bd-type quinol oxidase subunit 2 [Nocardioides aromaticivorans]
MRGARGWHVLTAAVTVAAVVLQLVLVVQGGRVLDEVEPPGLGLRLARFIAYFTIQSNILVAVATTLLALSPDRDGAAFRALRLAATVGITVTGLVHFFLLRPLLDLTGADWAADKLLHMVVPVLAVVGWFAFGPRPRVDGRAVAVAFAWPIAWLAVTLAVAGATRWVPYPFLDFRAEGWAHVAVVCLGITVLFSVLIAGFRYADRQLTTQPATTG